MNKELLLKELETCTSLEACEALKEKYLGKTGILSAEFKTMSALSPEEKKTKGQVLSEYKKLLEDGIESQIATFKNTAISEQLQKELVDASIPGIPHSTGHYTLLAQTRRQVEQIFQGMGFAIEYGHDVVTKFENFYSVNIPATHPATEMHDTFYLHQKEPTGENYVLRTHTSAMQHNLIKKYGAPCKFVVPGKVYRYENTDASHDTVFRQVEGVVIDKDVSIAHLKSMMIEILSALFGKAITIRLRPAFFPFVEPWFEIDASCPLCEQKGCSLCKHTWRIEILWAGMIHPNVLTMADIDPSVYQGYAFGLWINRMVAIMHSINDIRLFTNGDLRFVNSF